MLALALLAWPFTALGVVLAQGRRGHAAVEPFALAGVTAFLVTGVLLVMALTTQPDFALTYLFYGTATFGGSILSTLSAMTLARFAAREAPDEPRDPPGHREPPGHPG